MEEYIPPRHDIDLCVVMEEYIPPSHDHRDQYHAMIPP
jgi:hypothetical protein